MKKKIFCIFLNIMLLFFCASSFNIHQLMALDDSQYYYENDGCEIYINSTKEEVLHSLLRQDNFSINGVIYVNGKNVGFDDYLNTNFKSRFEITQWLYDVSFFSINQKIECFCDLILNRNFENSFCLNWVFNEILEYKNCANDLYEEKKSVDILNKIETILSNPFEKQNSNFPSRSLASKTNYLTTNFNIHYDSSLVNQSEVIKVAEEFERVRTEFNIRGFELPILSFLNSRFHVYLDPYASEDGYGAVTNGGVSLTNTCSSSITIYNFDKFNQYIREVISHEYFHAIQNAYNYHYCWFAEATASWAIIEVNDEYPNALDDICDFITSETNVTLPNASGSILFPLTIEKEYGGYSAIKSIYEEYHKYGTSLNFSQVKQIVTDGIVNNGYTGGSFDDAYKKMMTYIIDIENQYEGIMNWEELEEVSLPINFEKVVSNIYPISEILNPYTSAYNKLYLENMDTANLDLYITFNNIGGFIQLYIENINGNIAIDYYAPSDNAIFISLDFVGEDVRCIYVVSSNISETSVVAVNIFVTYTHYHNSNKGYQYKNALNHNVICSCDTIIVEPHNFKPYGSGNRCVKCLYYTEGPVIVGPIYKSE